MVIRIEEYRSEVSGGCLTGRRDLLQRWKQEWLTFGNFDFEMCGVTQKQSSHVTIFLHTCMRPNFTYGDIGTSGLGVLACEKYHSRSVISLDAR